MEIIMAIVFILVGIIWYDAILSMVQVFKAKSIDEVDTFTEFIYDNQIKNKLLLIICVIIRLPLIIISIIPIFIKVCILCKRERESK